MSVSPPSVRRRSRLRVSGDVGPSDAPVTARILKWRHGKRGVFMVEFDDSAPTHLNFVIPALKNRGIPGTFYINPGNGPYRTHQAAWEREAVSAGIELANHTFSHIGGATVEEFEKEIVQANEVIDRLYPQRPPMRLRGWARPGVPAGQWGVSEREIQQVLVRHHMIERPAFFGPPFSLKTTAEMLAWVDDAVREGEMRHLVFHGVGGDWHSAPLDYFLALLDKLEACAGSLWLTDPLSWHKYERERSLAQICVIEAGARRVRLALTSACDPIFYDLPLTIAVRTPAAWTHATVGQNGRRVRVPVADGELRFEAMPDAGEIVLQA